MTVDVVADPQGSSLVTPVAFSQEPFITFARPYRRGPLAEFVGDGEDGGLRLVGALDAPIQVDGTLFPVAADARYVVAIDLTVADASTNAPLGIGFFDVCAEFERVLVDLRAEPIGLGVATIDPSGRCSIPATVPPGSALTLTTDGDASSWPRSVSMSLG